MNAFKTEWKDIFTNRILLGTIVVLMFVPIMYSGIFLSSAWDPYGKTEELPVAVVNADKPAVYEDTTLNLGQELVDQLSDNQSLQWHFVDGAKARKGLEDGDYYMVITIPEDFSANASTVLDENPKQMTLSYEINPGKNYFASVVSSQAAASVKESMAANITKVYAKTLLDQIRNIGEGMQEAAEGSTEIRDGLGTAKEGNFQMTAGLQKLADSTLTFSDGSQQLVVALNSVQSGITQLNNGAQNLDSGISSYTAGVDTLYTGSHQFVEGANQLISQTPELLSGAQALATGAEQMVSGLENLSDGSHSALNGSTGLTQGLKELNSAVSQMTDENAGVPILSQSQAELNTGILALQSGANSLQNGLTALASSLPSKDETEQLSQGLQKIQDGMNQVANQTTQGSELSDSSSSIEENMSSMQQALAVLSSTQQTNSKNMVTVIQETDSFQSLADAQKQELLNVLDGEMINQANQQNTQIKILSSSLSDIGNVFNNDLLPAINGIDTLPSTIQQLNEVVNNVNPKAVQAISSYTALDAALNENLIPGSEILNQGLTEAIDGSDRLVNGIQQLNAQMPMLSQSTNQLLEGSQGLTDGLTSLSSGSEQIVNAASQFGSGSNQFSVGVEQYSQGIKQLSEGAQQIGGGLDQLADKSEELSQGATALSQGMASLSSNFPEITAGVEKLNDGAEQFQNGSTSLLQGSNDLSDGINQLELGTEELNSKLSEGAHRIEEVNNNDSNAVMIAEPINLNKQEYSNVPNYGHALAPYVLILGLFIGAIAFNMVFPLSNPVGNRSGLSWWLSKFSVGALQATFAALVMVTITVLGMHLQVDNLFQFILLAITASITFMFFVMLLNVAFGNLGRLLSMILLVIQLGASGGMFPMELTNKFFNAMHWVFPMTYAVEGLRSALSTSMTAGQFGMSMVSLFGFIILLNLLLLSIMIAKSRKASSHQNHSETVSA